MPSSSEGAEPICISGVTEGSQQLTLLQAEGSLTGNEWEKHPIVTGPEAPCILGIDHLQRGYFKDPKGYRWAFGIAALETEEIEPLSTLRGLSEDPSVVGLLRVEEQQVPIATRTVHRQQYRTNRDSLVPIHKLIHQLEGQRVISRTRSPFNSPIWPVRKSNGEWRLTVDYRGLNEVTPPMSAAVPDMLELQYELESKAAKWYATIDIANAFFLIPLAAECRPQFAFTWRGVQYTWNRLPQGWKHSPTICHGLIQTALEKGEPPEHLQYIDDIIVWGNTAEEAEREEHSPKPSKAGFTIKRTGENGPTWSLWQKAPGDTRGRPLGFWSQGYRGSEARYTPTEKEILAAYEGVRAASEVIGTEAQLFLAPRLPVLGWMFKERAPSTHHGNDATWSKWVTLITHWARIGSPNRPGILEVITDWPEGKDFVLLPEEEVTRAEEATPYNKLTEDEKPYALFTDGSCCIVGKHRRWKAAVWSSTRRVAEAAEGEGESSQFSEVKAIQLALDIAEREKGPTLSLYTDSWMVANALWGWLQQWKRSNWQRRGKPIWAAPLWRDIAAWLEKLVVKVCHVDAHVPRSRATEEHQNNQQVDQAAKIEVAQVDLDLSVTPIHKKKYTRKSVRLVRDDDEPGPSREQEEEPEPEVITRSPSLSELRDMRKDFRRLPGEHIITWLLRCWDNGASSLELEGREAKQLGSLSREGGIDKAIGKKAQALSLWRQLLSSVRERYPFSEDVVCRPGKWTTMERGIQYLRELAVREMVYYDPDNAQLPTDHNEVQCTRPMWQKFVQSAPSSYANSLAVIDWKSEEWMKWLADSGNMKRAFLPPSSRLWRNCPSTSGNSKRIYLTPHLHRPVLQLLGLTLLEAEGSLIGNEWEKHPIVTGPEAPCILGIDYLQRGYFKDPKGYRWAFGIAALEAEEMEPLSSLPGPSEDPSVVGLLRVEEQQVPIATRTVHRQQYRTNRDSLVPIHKLIHQLEGQGVISRTRSPFNSPIWPVWKSNGEWRLTVDYRSLNEVTPPMSAAVPDMLDLQYELESKAAKWYATIDIANAFFLIPLAAECRPQFAFTWRGVQYTWNRLPQGWKHSPTLCHGLIQTALEQGEPPEHLQYIDDIIVWGNSAEEVSEKGKKIIQILLQAGFTIKRKDEKPYAFFTDGSCRIVGKHRRWKAGVWSPTRRVAEAAEGEGESSQFSEVKAIQLALDIAEREKWPTLSLYTDSWMVGNALWGWLQQWKRSNWQRRGKPIWAAPLWQDIAAWLEKLVVKVCHVDAHVPRSRATEEHQNNQQVDQAAKTEVAQVDLDWQRKGELFIARWAHDTSGHQGRDAT
ncbi:hypothetical protein GRJ2_001381700 [Grus japonensis]|uniref:ribonuclease H n=1 Tax=Grus japonensis TaxID=30415 RepID=A0ABC9WUN4_GRUJA